MGTGGFGGFGRFFWVDADGLKVPALDITIDVELVSLSRDLVFNPYSAEDKLNIKGHC